MPGCGGTKDVAGGAEFRIVVELQKRAEHREPQAISLGGIISCVLSSQLMI